VTVRGLGLVGLLATFALVGALWSMQARKSGPGSEPARTAESQAQQVSAAANFGQAAVELQAYFAENGSYAGATLPPAFGVVLARADASSYCLQAGTSATAQHLAGPGGTPAAGPC
jgi:hypothetical protein